MKNKILVLLFITTFSGLCYAYEGGTLAPTIIAGSIIKNQGAEISKKYPRKDCPVCKGLGWYISGDKITRVPCGYGIEDKKISLNEEPKKCLCDHCKKTLVDKIK
jgi:hypothetical protein